MRGAEGDEIVFTLYEDCQDAAHRLGTFKLSRNRVLQVLDDQGENWIRLDSTRFQGSSFVED